MKFLKRYFLLLALLLPAGAWAQCNLNTYPNPVGGGVLAGNCAPAVTPLTGDLLLGFQPSKPQGQQTRAFSLGQIQTFVLGGGGGGPFLPLTGGTLTGTLGVTGALSAGTGSAAWVTATGGASATLGTGGTGNLTLNVRSAGTGTVNIGGSAFSAVQIFPAATNGGILQITQPTTASNLISFATSNLTTGGLNFTSPMLFTRNVVAYSGDRASTILNRPFTLSQSIAGISNDLQGFGINLVSTDYAGFSTAVGARTFFINSNINANSAMQQLVGLSVHNQQSGQPLTPTDIAWLPSHAYTVGQQVVNGVNLYTATVAGTSAGSGGPTGTGAAIVDGGVTWGYNNNAANMQGMIATDILQTSTKNLGGTANGAVGSTWGMVLGNFTSSAATFYSQANVLELDDNVQGSVRRSFTLALSKLGNQGSVYDYGIAFVGNPPSTWKNPMVFQNAIDPNGVGISVGKDLGTLQTMAGFINCLLCSTTGSNTQPGTAMGGGGYILRGPNAQFLGTGDLQIGNASFVISANTLTIDTTYQLLTAVGALSGGTKWTSGQWAADDYGNIGAVTAVAGVPTALSIVGLPKTYVATASVPGGAVTWHPMTPGVFPDATGGTLPIDNFTTASETYSSGTTIALGTGAATVLNIGRAAGQIGFFGTAAAAKPTGVAVTAAGVHAALVTLGLISP